MSDGLIGHDAAVRSFLDAAASDRLHHAWLLAGPPGIGKARFADLAARRLLAAAADPRLAGSGLDLPDGNATAALMDAGSHPDFRRLERVARTGSEEIGRSIRVEQVRALGPFFGTTPSLSPRRVVVIDAMEEAERATANALLKNLEEPPAGTIFLVVSHAPGRLLPTIRSRCRLLRFERLGEAESARVLRRALPEADAGEIASLARLAEGAPGAALRFAGLDVAGLDAAIERLASGGDPTGAGRAQLARTLAGKAAQGRYEAFLGRAPARIAAAAREGGAAMPERIDLWRRARDIADRAVGQSLDPQATVFELAGLVVALAPADALAKA